MVKLRAGDPSLAELRRRTGIPVSTLYDALNPDRRRLPSLELVRALVRACDERPQTLARFEASWLALKQAQDGPPPAAPGAPARPYVPRQLPALIQGFAGREGYQRELDEALLDGAPSVAVITGTAGVGKTSLAVSWAQRAAGRFPDGQLFVDLRGHSATPALAAEQALSLLLQSLGVAGESIPVDLELQTGLYRSLLAERRLLLVLDNAADVDQVRPLLPGSAGCHVVITSRNTLGGLVVREGARRIDLDVLDGDEALDLLRVQLGGDRVQAEVGAARRLAALCSYLPLALRIAAANLAGRPGQSLARFTADLHGANRLAQLQVTG
ncbi:MAG: transcriptional regulator, partial [Kitasatospora sp.]|nr:transcriptional regulator [Kitasatospora sp.]